MAFLRRLFRRADYESDVTQFISELRKNDPQMEARQRAGRALLWDREQNREAARDYAEARVPQQPYVYGTEPTEK